MSGVITVRKFLSRTPLLLRSILVYGCAAVVIVTSSFLVPQDKPVVVSAAPFTEKKVLSDIKPIKQGMPNRVTAERWGVDVPVWQGIYDTKTGEWTLSEEAAYFAVLSRQPNDQDGSTFIYGHNRASVFTKLYYLEPGDIVKVFTDNGLVFSYSFQHYTSVAPDMTSILYEKTDHPQLVLMTCEGLWSATRRIMYFNFLGVEQ